MQGCPGKGETLALKQDLLTDAFLASYAKVMMLIVSAMILLQDKTTSYMGNLIPTIMGLKGRLGQSTDRLEDSLFKVISVGIDRRFQAILSDEENLIASVLQLRSN